MKVWSRKFYTGQTNEKKYRLQYKIKNLRDVTGERKSQKVKRSQKNKKSGYKKCHISSKLHTWRRSDWHPHNMTGISGQSGQTPDQTNKQWVMTCHKICHISSKWHFILPGVGPTGIHTIWREHLAGAAEVPLSICFWHYTAIAKVAKPQIK